jgi:hypothetical protein
MDDAKVKQLAAIMDLALLDLLTICEDNPMVLMGILGARLKLFQFIIRDHEVTDMSEAKEIIDRIKNM